MKIVEIVMVYEKISLELAICFLDDVIEPKETRPKLIAALKACQNKRDTNPPRKHNTMPL